MLIKHQTPRIASCLPKIVALSGLLDPRIYVCNCRFTPNGRVLVPPIS
jgi:hypothetical protein